MKIRKIILSILISTFTFSVCGCASTDMADNNGDVLEVNIGIKESGNRVEPIVEEKDPMEVTVYYADMMFTKLLQEDIEIPELDAEYIIDALAGHNIVSTDTRVLEAVVEEGDKRTLKLNLSKQFKEYLKLMNEDSEKYLMAALTNTFLKAYDVDQMYLKVEGKALNSKYNKYVDALVWSDSVD